MLMMLIIMKMNNNKKVKKTATIPKTLVNNSNTVGNSSSEAQGIKRLRSMLSRPQINLNLFTMSSQGSKEA